MKTKHNKTSRVHLKQFKEGSLYPKVRTLKKKSEIAQINNLMI